jgi:hypothetical protein
MGRNGIRALCAVAALAAGLSACSQEGNLVVKNEGASTFQGYVENQSVTIDPGMSYKTSIYIGKNLTVIGPTDISIIVKGSSATKKLFSDEVWIKSNETATYPITDDVGALNFRNAYSLQVNGIQLKRCAEDAFGPNIVEKNHTLAPGTTRVIQFDPGCWDILVDYGREDLLDTVTSVTFEVGRIITIPWVPGYEYVPPAPPPVR